jgi:cystathionine beta-synthase
MDTKHHWSGVLDSAADAVGHTPLINLRRLAQAWGINCNIRQ